MSGLRMRTLPRLVGIEVADAGGERREGMQRLAEGAQAQRLHVVFEVGMRRAPASLRMKAPSCEGAMLIGPVRRKAYSSADAQPAPEARRQHVQRAHAAHLEHRPDLQVILQVGADARELVHQADAVLAQQRRRPDARELQDLRRADAPAARITSRAALTATRSAPRRTDTPLCSAAPSRIALEHQALCLSAGPDVEVGASAHRPQEGLGRVPARRRAG